MDDLSEKINECLQRAWPAISTINWPDYGEKITGYDPQTNLPKYTGVIIHSVDDGSVCGANTQSHGILLFPATSAQMVMNKVTSLLECRAVQTSIDIRNPKEHIYGGGIRLHGNVSSIYALSGLPEIADHVLIATLMLRCCPLSESLHKNLLSLETNQMNEALNSIGMSPDQYTKLVEHMLDIIQ